MDWQGWFTLALTVGVLITLIAIPRLSADLVLMAALLALSMLGILQPAEALAGFSNPGLMTVAAMFIVAAGIRSSGGVDLVVDAVLG
ncbi:MAG: SLC13 family permease, partial [Gammaproteobacteria bacterium]